MSLHKTLIGVISKIRLETCPHNSIVVLAFFLSWLEVRKVFNGLIAGYSYQQIPFVLLTNVAVSALIICVFWTALTVFLNGKSKKWVFYAWYAFVLVASLAAYQFLHKTGTLVDYRLTIYFVKNLMDLTPVLLSGADINFWVQLLGIGSVVFFLTYFDEKNHILIKNFAGLFFGTMAAMFLSACVYNQTVSEQEKKPVLNASYHGPMFSYFSGTNQIGIHSVVKPSDLVEVYREPVIIQTKAAPPNIIFVVLESMRFDAFLDIKNMINKNSDAVELKKIFGEGRQLNNLYTSVSHTSKAMVGIHCGVFPHPVMNIVESLPDGKFFKCLPEALVEVGYKTAHFQTALGRFENRPGLAANLGFQKIVVGEDLKGKNYKNIGYFGLDDMAMVQPAADWIAEQKQPYFIQLLTVGTHHPYQTPEGTLTETRAAYDEAAQYSVKFLDAFFSKASESSALNNTIVVIFSDHGEAFGEHGRFQHDMVPYEEVVHTPAIIWWPENIPSGSDEKLRSQLDIYPTMLDAVAEKWSGHLTGKSLLRSAGHENIYSLCWYTYSCMSVRHQNGLKVIYNFRQGTFEVYDLRVDPGELNNLRADYSNTEIIELFRGGLTLKASMDEFYKKARER